MTWNDCIIFWYLSYRLQSFAWVPEWVISIYAPTSVARQSHAWCILLYNPTLTVAAKRLHLQRPRPSNCQRHALVSKSITLRNFISATQIMCCQLWCPWIYQLQCLHGISSLCNLSGRTGFYPMHLPWVAETGSSDILFWLFSNQSLHRAKWKISLETPDVSNRHVI